MSIEACVQFEKLVMQAPLLQEKLIKAGAQDAFIRLAVQLGEENRFKFTPAEILFLISLHVTPPFLHHT
ncbi:MAG: hypothetical protein GY862_10955 [Gammaproteobacteria bacterium]|nr:hypothetical protein [Gammaproteobacteria bacterium]